MCISKFYKGEIYTSRNSAIKVGCIKESEFESSSKWVIVSSSLPQYQYGDWFESPSMGHALPCKNPNAIHELDKGCRLHALDALHFSSTSSREVNHIVLSRELVPNNTFTDMIVKGSTQVKATPATNKVLSVTIVADPQKVAIKKASATNAQPRQSNGRFLSKTVTKTIKKQGRDAAGRFLPKR